MVVNILISHFFLPKPLKKLLGTAQIQSKGH